MSYEPLVTIPLSEYNELIKMRDNSFEAARQWAGAKDHGVVREWKDITTKVPHNLYGERFTLIRTVSRDAGPFTAEDIRTYAETYNKP